MDRSYRTGGEAFDTDLPLAVINDKGSASASVIVTGVMQDYDRGVLLGQRSYGKGLVPNTVDIGSNGRLQRTNPKKQKTGKRFSQRYTQPDSSQQAPNQSERHQSG